MKRQLLLIVGLTLLLSGWFSAFLLNSIPQYRTLYIIVPTLLLGTGMGVVLKVVGGKLTALTIALTALTALLTLNQLFPSSGVSISAFQSRMHDNGNQSRSVSINVRNEDQSGLFSTHLTLEAFDNIEIDLFSQLPAAPAQMAFDDDDNLYVTLPDLGAIYRLKKRDEDDFADKPELFYVGLDRPTGLAWTDDHLYVAEPSQVLVLNDTDKDGRAEQVTVLSDNFPDDGGHWRRVLAASNNQLFLSIGSRCDACEEENSLRATVQVIDTSDGNVQTYAKGLRNISSLALDSDNSLWATDLGREGDADTFFPDEINKIINGADFGWPECYGERQSDPQLVNNEACQTTVASQFELPAEATPTGLVFGHNLKAPEPYRKSIYITLGGLSQDNLYRLIRIPYDGNKLGSNGKEFLRGWGRDSVQWGKPGSLIVGSDGDLYLSDEISKAIYKIQWSEVKNN
jgi:glucose/arabinose dehydrogenase